MFVSFFQNKLSPPKSSLLFLLWRECGDTIGNLGWIVPHRTISCVQCLLSAFTRHRHLQISALFIIFWLGFDVWLSFCSTYTEAVCFVNPWCLHKKKKKKYLRDNKVQLSAAKNCLHALHSKIYSELKHKTHCFLEHIVLHFPVVKLYHCSGLVM